MEMADILECNFCDRKFNSKSDLAVHKKSKHAKILLESKVKEMISKLTSEKYQLSLKLSSLKVKESKEVGLCQCRSYCRIFHLKHNWKRSESDVLLKKIRDL